MEEHGVTVSSGEAQQREENKDFDNPLRRKSTPHILVSSIILSFSGGARTVPSVYTEVI